MGLGPHPHPPVGRCARLVLGEVRGGGGGPTGLVHNSFSAYTSPKSKFRKLIFLIL